MRTCREKLKLSNPIPNNFGNEGNHTSLTNVFLHYIYTYIQMHIILCMVHRETYVGLRK